MKFKFIVTLLITLMTIQNVSAFGWWGIPPKDPVTGNPIQINPKTGGMYDQIACHNAQAVLTTGLEMIERGMQEHDNLLILQGRDLVKLAGILFTICGRLI